MTMQQFPFEPHIQPITIQQTIERAIADAVEELLGEMFGSAAGVESSAEPGEPSSDIPGTATNAPSARHSGNPPRAGGKPALPALPAVVAERPADPQHGDYASNVAMQLARTLRKPPLHIAEAICLKLVQGGRLDQLAARIEAVPPGFINVYIDWQQWALRGFPFQAAASGGSPGKAIVEHTSINPNKAAHIGHLRNACIGDTIVRLLRSVGYTVEVHNYIDDLGNQLADTVVGLQHTTVDAAHARFGDFCWDVYAAINQAYNDNPDLLVRRSEVLHALEQGGNNIAWTGLLVAERIVREHVEEMAAFNIGYDLLVWESSIVRAGFWETAFELLRRTGQFVQETEGKLAGCWVLKQITTDDSGGAHDDSKDNEAAGSIHSADKVLVRSNGILTYTAKDIAYHLWKFGLLTSDFAYKAFADRLATTANGDATANADAAGYADGNTNIAANAATGDARNARYGQADLAINVIDHRQAYPQAMVKQALEALGYHEQAAGLRHVSYGVVSLSPQSASELDIDISDGRAAYAMSGRQGIGIKIAKLLELMEASIEAKRSSQDGLASRVIAAAAIRYYLLRFSLETEVVFDMKQATEVTGNSGVYLMYAHARASSILAKAGIDPIEGAVVPDIPPSLAQPERLLLRQIAAWPDTLAIAARELSPTIICNYAYELAALFNAFYAACPILNAAVEERVSRLSLVVLFKRTLAAVLDVLGLPAADRI